MAELVAWWTFEDLIDKSGNGHDLVKIGDGELFDGSTYLECPTITGMPNNSVSIAISFLSYTPSSDYGLVGFFENSGRAQFNIKKQTNKLGMVTGNNVAAGQSSPHAGNKLICTLENFNTEVFINGEMHFSGRVGSPSIVNDIRTLIIGADWDRWAKNAKEFFTGIIFDIQIFSGVVSSDFIKEYGIPDYSYQTIPQKLTWGSRLSREQAFPYNPMPVGKTFNIDNTKLVAKGHKSHDLHRKQGYITSSVTINGIPAANRRVICLTQAGQITDETHTNKSGKYRFDNLDLNSKYMIIAQDSPAFGDAEYNAVAADYQSPTGY